MLNRPRDDYYVVVNKLLTSGKIEKQHPNVKLALPDMQMLADHICSVLPWARPVLIQIADVRECQDENVILTLEEDFTYNSIPLAMISCKVSDVQGDISVEETPIVYFFHEEFLTVGVLLHELAHMYAPFDSHGDKFKEGHKMLLDLWNKTQNNK